MTSKMKQLEARLDKFKLVLLVLGLPIYVFFKFLRDPKFKL